MSTQKHQAHEEIVRELETHIEFFAVCPCCGNKPLEYIKIPRARQTYIELSCSCCHFTGSCKVYK